MHLNHLYCNPISLGKSGSGHKNACQSLPRSHGQWGGTAIVYPLGNSAEFDDKEDHQVAMADYILDNTQGDYKQRLPSQGIGLPGRGHDQRALYYRGQGAL